jgi:hypothetical protein
MRRTATNINRKQLAKMVPNNTEKLKRNLSEIPNYAIKNMTGKKITRERVRNVYNI